jgi:capsid protein
MKSATKRRGAAVKEAGMVPRAEGTVTQSAGYFGGGWSGYDGANWTGASGYVYWPSLDPKLEVDTGSRMEVARKAHYLCSNVGLAKRIIEGLTNLIVGTGLLPHATTSDAEWNALAEKAYNSRARSALTYSVNGRHTGVQAQRLMVKTRKRDGDAAVVFSKSQTGGALRAFYSGIQIGNARNTGLDQSKWKEGLFLDSLERIQTFRFPDFSNGGTFTDVPAENVRFLCRPDSPGGLREMSVLTHAVNKMVHITELNAAWMKGIKSSAEIGYYMTSEVGGQKPLGMDAALRGQTVKIGHKPKPGDKRDDRKKVTLKLVRGQGGEIVSLPAGVDLKTLLDTRPHPNSREFVEDFIRDIAAGAGVSSDLLWNIYKLGGANVRYVLADAQVFVSSEQQDLVDTWLTQDWVYTIACEVKAGRLRKCNDPEWWAHGWIPPARVTVDYGRDGNILLKMVQSGLLGTERFYSMMGQTARVEVIKELDFIQFRKKAMADRGLTIDDLHIYDQGRGVLEAPITPDGKNYEEEVVPDKSKTPPDDEDENDNDADET